MTIWWIVLVDRDNGAFYTTHKPGTLAAAHLFFTLLMIVINERLMLRSTPSI